MNTYNIYGSNQSYRQTAINSLAVVGFLALIALGVWGAIYSARYVPGTVGSAAVYLGSLFNPAPAADITVVPAASSTYISFGTPVATSTTVVATTTATTTPQTKPKIAPAPTYIQVVSTTPPPLYGYADLTIVESVVGYLTNNSVDSFVASKSAPSGTLPAIMFSVKNIGTNVSGQWRFTADIPVSRSPVASGFEKCESLTSSSWRCTSYAQQSLRPSENIVYKLGFDRANTGVQPITIIVNENNAVIESNKNNNSVYTTLTIN